MKNTNKILIFSIPLLIAIPLLLVSFYHPKTIIPIPEKYIGNWINKNNNYYEYGFFEDFVVFDNDFWDYKQVNIDNENHLNITLSKKNETIKLQLTRLNQNEIKVKRGHGKEEILTLIEKVYPTYPNKETESFTTPVFHPDSVTIIGYYRNLDKGIKGFAERFFRSPFEISVSDFLTGKENKYYGDIDNLGRFKLTFPVMNTQELYVDWKRTRIKAVVEPGDTLFLFADINDYIPTDDDKKDYEAYVDRPKQVLFMGDNARLNNEIRQYNDPWISLDKNKVKDLKDMDYLHACEDVYSKRIERLNEYIEKETTVSEKFRVYKKKAEKSDFSFNLMQHRFDLYKKGGKKFQDGYIQYVERNFPMNDELDYTLTRFFNTFLNDYLGYISNQYSSPNVLFGEIGNRLQQEGKLTNNVKQQIEEINKLVHSLKGATNKERITEALKIKAYRLNQDNLVKEIAGVLHEEKLFLNTTISDSLISNPNLCELWTTNRYQYWFEVLHKPLSAQQQIIFKQKVKNPYLRDYLAKRQKYYSDVANKRVTYEASLKNTKQLNEYTDAEKLFKELIKPYKGKVVYVDFWGSWCSPCRRDLKVVNELKEKLNEEDVIFMYFANRTPETTWKNLINEMNLAGKNVVHYRLPDAQQGMIERKLGVTVFPTYMLINKEGIIVNQKAKSPNDIDGVIGEIRDLLK